MKLAIATDKDFVSEHFGRCPEFTIATIKDNKILEKKIIKNPGHKTGYLPRFFKEQGVKYVITGGIGFKAQQLFKEFNIEIITGVQGKIDEVINSFIKKELTKAANICTPGKGKDYGIEKEDKYLWKKKF